jgi:hypothetical protein
MGAWVAPIKDPEKIQEIRRLLADSPILLLLFNLGVNCPFRIDTLLQLRIRDVFARDGRPLPSLLVYESKREKKFIHHWNEQAIRALAAYSTSCAAEALDPDAWLFPSRQRGKKMSRQYVWRLVKEWAEQVGLEGSYGGNSLRKTWGYKVWVDTERADLLMAVLGKQSIQQLWDFLDIGRGEISKPYDPALEQHDNLRISRLSQHAQAAVKAIQTIDAAKRSGHGAFQVHEGMLLSPYREAMIAIFHLYQQSVDWDRNRRAALAKSDGRCSQCNREATVAHHLTYENWATSWEEVDDLTPLCEEHHRAVHASKSAPVVPFWAKRAPETQFVTEEVVSSFLKDVSV